MVTAMTAEATATRVVIRNPGGSVAKTIRGDFYGRDRGVDLSAVDVALDGSGYVQGTWRWQEGGSYWKAVVVPEDVFRQKYPPAPERRLTREENMRVFGNPEGRRWTEPERRARAAQVKATGKVTGWERRL